MVEFRSRVIPKMEKVTCPDSVAISTGLGKINRICGQSFGLARRGLFGKHCCGFCHKGHLFLAVETTNKPPRQRLLVSRPGSVEFLAPSEDIRDLLTLCASLGEDNISDIVFWHEFTGMDYGLVQKRAFPHSVSKEDMHVGAEIATAIHGNPLFTSPGEFLWQEWGGHLFWMKYVSALEKKPEKFVSIAWGIGKCKELPYWRLR